MIIITNDKDFGYLIVKQRLKCPGVIFIRKELLVDMEIVPYFNQEHFPEKHPELY